MIFTNVVKPTHICNLACDYCYNEDVRDPVMKDSTLDRVIEQTYKYVRGTVPHRLVSFIWHGGEPMVVGIPFYEKVVKLQKKFSSALSTHNSIQTNGTLINSEWIDFFKEAGFSISISIDGPAHLHDKFRTYQSGKGSFNKVFNSILAVKEANLPLGVCVVISRANAAHVEEIYNFLASHKLRFNIIPMNRSGVARENYADVGLEAEEYSEPWIRMYDRWFDADEDYVYCSDFVFKTRAILAGKPADCIGLEQCSHTNISVDPVGDVYPCATLSGSIDTRYGNLINDDLSTIMNSKVANEYGNRQMDKQCETCRWQHVCHGGCQARAYKFFGDHNRRDYYCPSLFKIYEHIEKRLNEKFERSQPLAGVIDSLCE